MSISQKHGDPQARVEDIFQRSLSSCTRQAPTYFSLPDDLFKELSIEGKFLRTWHKDVDTVTMHSNDGANCYMLAGHQRLMLTIK
ncbi:MAG: hypothetical protein COB36_05685 [Alphaproteobacteria bacterium]|nr:MAG: hypothetical protein COB36_05685 [Alphaproteobacteria bacterium]